MARNPRITRAQTRTGNVFSVPWCLGGSPSRDFYQTGRQAVQALQTTRAVVPKEALPHPKERRGQRSQRPRWRLGDRHDGGHCESRGVPHLGDAIQRVGEAAVTGSVILSRLSEVPRFLLVPYPCRP